MKIITLYHGIIDRMSHIQRQNLSPATHPQVHREGAKPTTGPQGGGGGDHDQTMTRGGVRRCSIYMHQFCSKFNHMVFGPLLVLNWDGGAAP